MSNVVGLERLFPAEVLGLDVGPESHGQHHLPRSLTPFKRPMGISRISQCKRRTNPEVQPPVLDAVEEHGRTLGQFLR